jgi:two-component system chemotaxis sensor kinase CheA
MAQPSESGDTLETVIYKHEGRTVGVLVDGIIDIVDEPPAVEPFASRPGVISSFVSDHNVIEMLDLPAIVRSAIPNFDKPAQQSAV